MTTVDPLSDYQHSGLTRVEFEDRQALHAAIAVAERRWPDSDLLRELREQAETIASVE